VLPVVRSVPVLVAQTLLCSTLLSAQPNTWNVVGVESFDLPRVQDLIRGASLDTAIARIGRMYADDGFLDIDVSPASASILRVTEGIRYRFNRVSVSLSDSLEGVPQGWIDAITLPRGEPYSTATVERLSLSIVARLTAAGYALATVLPTLTLHSDSANVDVHLTIVPASRVRISRLEVAGNTTTRRSLIEAAAKLPDDSLFTEELSAAMQRRVDRLGLFTRVDVPLIVATDTVGQYALLLRVVERSPNSFDGVLGFQPADTAGGDPTIVGKVSVVLGNIFGSGRRLALRWTRQTTVGSQLELRYLEPFLFNVPLAVDGAYQQRLEEESSLLLSYAQRSLSVGATYGVTDAFSIRLGGALEWIIPEVDSTVTCARQLASSEVSEASAAIEFDTRSDPFNPLTGLYYRTSYAIASRSDGGSSPCDSGRGTGDSRRRVELDLESFLPLYVLGDRERTNVVGTIVAAGNLHYREVSETVVDEGDLYRIGGGESVRGYREGEYRGSRAAWGGVEIRVVLAARSYASLFFDAAFVSRPADPLRPQLAAREDVIAGYGIGAQVETGIGLLRISYALGKDDTFATGKVSFGLVTQF